MARRDWWWVISAVLVVATAGGVTTVAALRAEADRALTHAAPLTIARPAEALTPVPTDGDPTGADPATAEVVARLDAFAADLEQQVEGKAASLRERIATA